MSMVTYTTDLGSRNYHVALSKARLLNEAPQTIVVDICNEVNAYDISEAAYLLRSCWRSFPFGTVHLIGVRSELKIPPIIVEKGFQYFVMADNGIAEMLFDESPDGVYEITMGQEEQDEHFPMGGLFARVAAHLSKGGKLEMISRPFGQYKKQNFPKAYFQNGMLMAQVIHIDVFDNIVLNVHKEEYGSYFDDYSFKIYARGLNKSSISRIYSNFQDDQILSGTPMSVWGTNGYLMIGLRDSSFKTGGAGKLMGYRIKDTLSIEFRDKENR